MIKQVRKRYLLTLLLLGCIFSVNAQNPHAILDWAKLTGSTGFSEFGLAVTTDMDGNVYNGGQFDGNYGAVDFDPGPGVTNVTANYGDAFVVKFDAAGNFKWVRHFGGGSFWGAEAVRAIRTDPWGNVYVTAEGFDSIDFNPGGTGGITKGSGTFTDVFVVKYKSNGDFVWVKRMGSNNADDKPYDMQVDDSGSVYLVGEQSDTGDFDPGPGVYNLISQYYSAWGSRVSDIFVCKLDSAGNLKWARNFGSDGPDYGYGIAVDKDHNVYTTGHFVNTADFDPAPGAGNVVNITSSGSWDIFMSKLDMNGNFIWARGIGGPGQDDGTNIAVDKADNIYLTGVFVGTTDFDPGTGTTSLTSKSGSSDIFICKYSPTSSLVWARSIGSTDYDQTEDIAVDERGNPFVVGFFGSGLANYTIDLDPGTGTANYTSNGDYDMFIVKLSTNGDFKWGKGFGGSSTDVCKALSLDGHGSIYTAGYTMNTVDFDPNAGIFNLTSNGGFDFFVQKLICVDTNSFVTSFDTCADSYSFRGNTYTKSGTYSVSYPNMEGCDSTYTLVLNLNGAITKPLITTFGFTLGTTMPYATYQWIKNGTAISGATNTTYTVTENGDYRVAVTNAGGCTDTSAVKTITNVGIGDISFVKDDIKVYPNPASSIVNVASPIAVNITVTTLDGRVVKEVTNAKQISLNGMASGMYLLRITDEHDNLLKVEKIIKQNN